MVCEGGDWISGKCKLQTTFTCKYFQVTVHKKTRKSIQSPAQNTNTCIVWWKEGANMKMFILVLKSKLNLEPEDCVLFSANKIVYVHFKTYNTVGIPLNSHLGKVMVVHK